MPASPCLKKKSPTTDPTTASVAATWKPVRIAGMAAGSCSFHSRTTRLAWCSVNSSCWPRSADCSPNSVLEMIGKIAISTVTISRLVRPKSNQNPITGTSASVGMHCRITAYG